MNKFKSRILHIAGWVRLIGYVLKYRGKETFGADDVQRILERHMMENSRSLNDYSGAESAVEESIKLLEPTFISGLARIGPHSDGGYIGLAAPAPKFLLSGGAGKNIDFEIELASQGAEVHVYDPTVTKLPKFHPLIKHQKKALCVNSDRRFKVSTNLTRALQEFNLTGDEIIWLKLDIEFSEWDLLADEIFLLPNFTQIFIEFHDTYKLVEADFRAKFLKVLRALNHDFNLISISSNNWQGIANFGHSFIPVTFEATFLNRSIPTNQLASETGDKLVCVNNVRRLPIPNKPFAHGISTDG